MLDAGHMVVGFEVFRMDHHDGKAVFFLRQGGYGFHIVPGDFRHTGGDEKHRLGFFLRRQLLKGFLQAFLGPESHIMLIQHAGDHPAALGRHGAAAPGGHFGIIRALIRPQHHQNAVPDPVDRQHGPHQGAVVAGVKGVGEGLYILHLLRL